MATLVLKRKDIKDLLKMLDVVRVVEDAFKAWGQDKTNMPPKAYLVVEQGDFRAMPAAMLGLSRNFTYELVKQKKLPVIEFGKRKLIPRIALEKMLGKDD